MTEWYLIEHPEKKGYVLCEPCFEKSKEFFVYLDLPHQPERSKREDLDDMRIYNADGTLHNPPCPICKIGRWNSLHQGCGALNSEETH
jgi:hypothetical protein